MKSESLKVSAVIPAPPSAIYNAWLSGKEHSAMTGGGAFTAWDGYISGKNLDLKSPVRILQSWRSTEFPADAPDSHLEILLEETKGGTKVTLVHTDIPQGQGASYKQGWVDHYFEPMKKYFSGKR
ncbi:MAG: SRPBCC domain-containing protein [Spirochaetia bacterium]|jgi:activator of HSP90 ATPase